MALCRWLLWVALPACAGAFFQEKIVPPPSLAASLAALAAHPAAVPVHIDIRQDADLRDATVTMCTLPWAAHAAQPHLYPMNRDLVTAARCFGAHSSDAAFTVTFAALEEEFFSRSCPVNGVYTDAYPGTTGCVPTGMIFHEARCGSTLAANMLASLPHTIVYSEALVPMIVAGTEHLVVEDRVRALRVMTAAMGRPAAAAAGGQPLHAAAAADDARAGTSGGPATAWQPYHVYFKFQSTMAVQLRILRLAFPDTPWLFLYRQPEEVLVSLLRMATTLPPPDAPASQFIAADDRGIRDAPCMRQRGAGAHPFIQAVVRAHSQDGAMLDVSAEAFCAISVAHLATAALHEANMARVAALQALRVQAAADNVLEAKHLLRVLPADVLAQLRSGVAGGIGQGLFVQYDKSPAHLIEAIRRHIPPRSVRIMRESTAVLVSPTLTDAEVETMAATARMYSKLRGPKAIVAAADAAAASRRAGLVRGLLRPLPASRNEAGHFLGDTKEKQQRAWAACRLAASTYLQPIHDAIRAWMLPLDASTVSGDSSSRPVEASSAPAAAGVEQAWVPYGAAARRLAIGNGYPQHYPLQEILREWNPDIVSIPKSAGRYQSLRIFDFATERAQAEEYRKAEVPFVIRNVPDAQRVIKEWASDDVLSSAMGTSPYVADVNDNNHFMYFHKSAALRNASYVRPTTEERVTVTAWLERARSVAAAVFAEEQEQVPSEWKRPAAQQDVAFHLNDPAVNGDAELQQALPKGTHVLPYRVAAQVSAEHKLSGEPAPVVRPLTRQKRKLWYMRSSTHARIKLENTWMKPFFPMFDPERPNFFMVEPAGFQGIHCRYGMPGIIAESHFDAGRNFIFMVRGRKRYILSSPQQCGNLHMMKSGPSARHSSLDWTSDAGISALMDSGAEALEVILEAGDALYVPSFWFHFIVSLSVNVQCNARSGTPPHGTAAIRECGFLVNPTEPAGLHTVAQPPAGHVVGLAPLFTDGVRVEDLLQLYSAGVDFYADFVQPEFRAPQLSRLMVAPLAAAPGAMARTLGERAEVASFQGSLKAVLAVTLLTLVVAVMVACLKLRGVSAVRPLRTRVLGSAFMRRVLASSTKAHAFQ